MRYRFLRSEWVGRKRADQYYVNPLKTIVIISDPNDKESSHVPQQFIDTDSSAWPPSTGFAELSRMPFGSDAVEDIMDPLDLLKRRRKDRWMVSINGARFTVYGDKRDAIVSIVNQLSPR